MRRRGCCLQDEYKDRPRESTAQRTLIHVLADSWIATAKWRKRKSTSSSRTALTVWLRSWEHKYFRRNRSVVVVPITSIASVSSVYVEFPLTVTSFMHRMWQYSIPCTR